MKKVLIIDGNREDEAKVSGSLGESYEVSSYSYLDINNMALSTVISIANTVDSLEVYSGGHSLRVAVCARDIAKNLGWDERKCQNIYFVSLLHDIGMISVSEWVRNKPGRLTPEEFELIKPHTVKGDEMLRSIDVLDNLSDGIKYHHERWDGKGYPEGLSGSDIPVFARVIAIADAYDAMSSDRVYRPRLSVDKIISEFTRCRGTQFDPEITDVFVFMLKDGYTVEPGIEQTKEASERAVRDSGLKELFTPVASDDNRAEEMDALTGLFTRSYLNTRVGNKISEERSGALMIIKITGYGDLSDRFGSGVADEMIKRFSQELKSVFRGEDIVCRVETDMFAVFVSGESGKGVIEKKAQSITAMPDLEELKNKYEGILGVGIGISMCQEDGITFEELYGAALDALDEAGRGSDNTYSFSRGVQ